ncbi:MAG: PRC-barrel domain-containing protein, partial [Planctomycetota bacterium]
MTSAIMTPLLLGLAVSSVLAQTPPEAEGALVPAIAVGEPGGSRCKASQLISCKISNSKNQDLGEILDIVLDARNEHVAYAVVTFGGVLGMDKKYFAMPWRLIEVSQRSVDDVPRATLGLDQATLQAAPGFDHSKWPDMADPTWAKQVDDYYRTRGEPARPEGAVEPKGSGADGKTGVEQQPASKGFVHRRLSKLIGMSVVDAERHPLGEVEDLVIDTRFATVDGALISFGGTLGIDEKFVLLPTEALTLDRKKGQFGVRCSKAEFEAMALVDGKIPALNNNLWRARGMELANRVETIDGNVIAVDASAVKAVPYVDVYDVNKTERVTATILTVGSVRVGDDQVEERLRLRMRSTDGRDWIVYAAPSDFASQAALGLRDGRVVEVTGSPVKYGTQTVLVAGSIAVEGKTAILRDAEGHAIWRNK